MYARELNFEKGHELKNRKKHSSNLVVQGTDAEICYHFAKHNQSQKSRFQVDDMEIREHHEIKFPHNISSAFQAGIPRN